MAKKNLTQKICPKKKPKKVKKNPPKAGLLGFFLFSPQIIQKKAKTPIKHHKPL